MIDENLPLGIIANIAAIVGITLGKQMLEAAGADGYDRTGVSTFAGLMAGLQVYGIVVVFSISVVYNDT